MRRAKVLAIGLDPACADPGAMGRFPPEMIRAHIETQLQLVRDQGWDVESCLIDRGATAEAVIKAALAGRTFDCVVIGAGVRLPPEQLPLFETVINLVHAHAPGARICFNTSPADTVDAVRRWIGIVR